jgi:hypothetical protein
MIQRIQSIYLLFASILVLWTGVHGVIATISLQSEGNSHFSLEINSYGISGKASIKNTAVESNNTNSTLHFSKSNISKTYPFYLIFYLIATGILVSICLFKNTRLQIRVSKFCIALLVLCISTLILFMIVSPQGLVDYYSTQTNEHWTASRILGLNFYLLCIAVILIVMAIQRIQKDIRFVKSIDRIR